MESTHSPSLAERLTNKDAIIANYIGKLENLESPEENDDIYSAGIADQLHMPGKPLARTVVIIPVAAAAEQTTIGHTLDEYSRQQPEKPFSIVLGLNVDITGRDAPDGSSPQVRETLRNLAAARRRHPELDIRSSFSEYTEPTIGEIRRDLWNGVLRAYQRDGVSANEEMVGINNDIDLVHLPRRYIAAIQRHYRDPAQAISPNYTQVRHAWDPTHPRTSQAVVWNDWVYSAAELGYEASSVIPMSFYAARGGIEAHRRTHEVVHLLQGSTPHGLLRTGRLQTSPRRFVDLLPKNGMDGIWTAESFGSEDACREPRHVAAQPDLSRLELASTLERGFENDVNLIFNQLGCRILDEVGRDPGLFEMASRRRAELTVAAYIGHEFTRKMRLGQRVMAACLPEGYRARANLVNVAAYDRQIQHSANQIVSIQLAKQLQSF